MTVSPHPARDSFFEYLKAAGSIHLNPASTKLVPPPELPSDPSGRALSAKEVRYLLSGPDREKPEGARDYALMLVMLRLEKLEVYLKAARPAHDVRPIQQLLMRLGSRQRPS